MLRRLAASLILVTACTAGGVDPDGGGGGGDGGAAPDAPAARTDLVPPVGTAGSVDVAGWNLREFPITTRTPEVAGDLIASLDLDLVGLVEINDAAAFDRMMARLYDYDGQLFGSQALVWRRDLLEPSDAHEIFTDQHDTFIRPPVEATFTVHGGAAQLTIILVHLKAGLASIDEQTRLAAVVDLEAHVRAAVDGGDDQLLVMGDFNEAIDDDAADQVFFPWVNSPDRYRFLTRPLAEQGVVTFLPAGVMLDHMVATAGLDDERGGETPLVPPLADELSGYQDLVSDHLPVVLRLPVLE